MGRSASCFKIITCGGDSAAKDDADAPENKSSKGWTFRKRSERHQVLSGSVITENPVHKEIPRSAGLDSQPIQSSEFFGKTSMQNITEEKPQSLVSVQDSAPISTGKDENDNDAQDPEPISTGKDENEGDVQVSEPISTVKDENERDVQVSEPTSSVKVENERDIQVSEPISTVKDEDERDVQVSEPISPVKDENERDVQDSETVFTGKDENERDVQDSETVFTGKDENGRDAHDFEPISSGKDENDRDIDLEESVVIEHSEEKPESLMPEPLQDSEPVSTGKDEDGKDVILEESVIVTIQTAVRGILAQRDLVKQKSVVKLQAAVRGHLVRKHAAGTLRCVQGIVKMQTLIRSRRARLSLEGSYGDKNLSKYNLSLEEKSATKPSVSFPSIEKLLSNKFARQLNESSRKNTPIKCDALKPGSAWSWLERWMSVSVTEQPSKPAVVDDQLETVKNENVFSPVEVRVPADASSESPGLNSDANETEQSSKPVDDQLEAVKSEDIVSPEEVRVPSDASSESRDFKSDANEAVAPSENKENLVTRDADEVEIEVSGPSSLETESLEQPQLEISPQTDANKETSADASSKGDQTLQSDAIFETENEQLERSMKTSASDQLETEAKKHAVGSRKASNPAFIAAQAKFKELSSKSSKSLSSSNQEARVEPVEDTASSRADASSTTKIPVHHVSSECDTEIPISPALDSPARSECDTEIPISPALDSPARSEVGAMESEQGSKPLEPESCISETTEASDEKSNDTSTIPLSNEPAEQPESVSSGNVADSLESEQEQEISISDPPCQQAPASPEVTIGSHTTIPEPQGTPSSQASSKAKKTKTDKTHQKRKSPSAAKTSPSKETTTRSSIEQLPLKGGKRRSSFGSTKPDTIFHEPRETSSSNSIPRFMQPTQSAKAKVHSTSPSSSPDVHDKDFHIKKRHSLPGNHQVSPKVQRPSSQTPHSAKGNSTTPTQERKWQR